MLPVPRRPGAHFSLTLWACVASVICFGVMIPWGVMAAVQRVGTAQSLTPATLPLCQLQHIPQDLAKIVSPIDRVAAIERGSVWGVAGVRGCMGRAGGEPLGY